MLAFALAALLAGSNAKPAVLRVRGGASLARLVHAAPAEGGKDGRVRLEWIRRIGLWLGVGSAAVGVGQLAAADLAATRAEPRALLGCVY